MNRRIPLLVVVLTLGALIAMVPLGAAVTGEGDIVRADHDASNGTELTPTEQTVSELTPGERMSGVIGVQEAEVDGELASRSFEARLADAETETARAAVVADQIDRNERRLAELQERQRELRERREAGNVSPGAYAARTAAIGATVASVNRTTDRSAEVAAELPSELREERGIDAERIQTLKGRASELSGPETAAIARQIGGNRTGAPMGSERDGEPGAGVGGPPGAGEGGGQNESSGGEPGADRPAGGENASDAGGRPANGSAEAADDRPGDGSDGNATAGGGESAGEGSGEPNDDDGAAGDDSEEADDGGETGSDRDSDGDGSSDGAERGSDADTGGGERAGDP